MKLIGWIFGIPLMVLMVILAVGNRHEVLVSASPAPFEIKLPLALLLFVALVVGVVWGGVAGWLAQGRLRAKARKSTFQADIYKRDLDVAERTIKDLRARVDQAEPPAGTTNLPSLPRDAA